MSLAGELARTAIQGPGPLQALGPSALTGTPTEIRAGVCFLLTVAFGGAVIYRYGSRLDGFVDASMSSPLLSALYGVMAYGIVAFMTGYAYSQLSQLLVGSPLLPLVVGAVFAAFVLALGGLGFVVVGAWLARAAGFGDPWLGLIGVGGASAVAWLVLPVAVAGLVWLVIAAVGIGGPARRWIHADAAEVRD
jgi:hypothetical protein